MAKTKKQGENSACSALFEHAYYSSGYGNWPHIFVTCILSTLVLVLIVNGNYRTNSNNRLDVPNYTLIWIFFAM